MFLTPARIKDNHVSNFGSKEWMNNNVRLIKVKGLVKPQRNNAINSVPSIGNQPVNIWRLDGDSIATSLLGQPGPFRQWLAAL